MLAGFLLVQATMLLGFPWYYGVTPLWVLLGAAGGFTAYFSARIRRELGYAGISWLGRKIRATWTVTALAGSTAYMISFWSPRISHAVFSTIPPVEISGLILTGWLIIDGIGCMVQGVLSESRAYLLVGLAMCASAILVTYLGFIYAWAAFALTFGLGWLILGLRDYSEFKRSHERC